MTVYTTVLHSFPPMDISEIYRGVTYSAVTDIAEYSGEGRQRSERETAKTTHQAQAVKTDWSAGNPFSTLITLPRPMDISEIYRGVIYSAVTDIAEFSGEGRQRSERETASTTLQYTANVNEEEAYLIWEARAAMQQSATVSGTPYRGMTYDTIRSSFCNAEWIPKKYPQLSGDGSEKNPYLIRTAEELREIRNNLSQHFILMKDIDLTSWGYWEPLGTTASPFTGSFNGNNHKITGLLVSSLNSGLFGINSGTVMNLTVYGEIFGEMAGLIAGQNRGTIAYCTVLGTVFCLDNCSTGNVGVLAGRNSGSIIYCSASGTVTLYDSLNVADAGCSGVLIGYNSSSGIIAYSASHGNVYGVQHTGGLLGHNDGIVSDCYTTANVHANRVNTGGISGCNHTSRSVIQNCYARGDVVGDSSVGGISGMNHDGAKIISCVGMNDYINGSSSVGLIVGSNASTVYNTYVSGEDVTDEELQSPEFYTDYLGWDFENVWTFDKSKSKYPILRWELPKIKQTIDLWDWNLRGVYPVTERGLMWGYWGTKVGE